MTASTGQPSQVKPPFRSSSFFLNMQRCTETRSENSLQKIVVWLSGSGVYFDLLFIASRDIGLFPKPILCFDRLCTIGKNGILLINHPVHPECSAEFVEALSKGEQGFGQMPDMSHLFRCPLLHTTKKPSRGGHSAYDASQEGFLTFVLLPSRAVYVRSG